ncbi:MAG TPA: gfo/Idh/MocA family oxidoreductase, partial [Verrucomicrobiae bacterium]|nr:gfo/Idh/MocA family oxidoreductase [Verrucomicrobiae bacterium]
DRMIATVRKTGKQLAVNWPLRWVASHVAAKRLLSEGTIGDLVEAHYYGGNRGPLYHSSAKIELHPTAEDKANSWWYKRASGGGSMLDYLGYGATLGTWFHDGRKPLEVTTVVDEPAGLEVDEHSITVCRYAAGLSRYETRWGTFTDPWVNQTQPKCGFVLVGTRGTISSYDYEGKVRIQTANQPEGYDLPVEKLSAPGNNPINYVIHCLESGKLVDGPLSLETSRTGQQIVDSAVKSAAEKRTVKLLE